MTPSTSSPTRSCSTLGRIFAVLGVLVLGSIIASFLAGAAILRNWDPAADLPDVRSALIQSLDIPRNAEIDVKIPTWVMTLGRMGISFTDLQPDVKAAMGALRGGHIGVYELAEIPKRESQLALVETADALLRDAGDWTRIVTVVEEQELVVIYVVESTLDTDAKIDLFLIVVDHRELVIASVQAHAKPVVELASSAIDQMDFGSPPQWIQD